MKQFYITLILLINLNILSAQSTEVGVTPGELSVSLTGAANYTVPIAVPPGINGIVPKVNLFYSSQSGNGNAGYGWNIDGLSTITRIASTKFHDDVIDAVDFDNLDRFALNGQRLILKAGSPAGYGGNGAVYETENYSNLKITSYGVSSYGASYGPSYFLIEYPDGSKAYYGNTPNCQSLTDWAISYWENAQGVRISYNYLQTNNVLDISSIKYGTVNAVSPINEILFNYGSRARSEQGYVGGQSFIKSQKLTSINVKGNNVGYRNYLLEYNTTNLGYELLSKITEKNGDNSKSLNPTVFTYDVAADVISQVEKPISANIGIGSVNIKNSAIISGDFDGDAKMDFALYPTTGPDQKKHFWLFKDLGSSSFNLPLKVSCGAFEGIFPSTGLMPDGKMFYYQGITVAQLDSNPNTINFNTYYNSIYGVGLENTKKAVFPIRNVQSCWDYINRAQEKDYFSGDFNGDGLTDVIALDKELNAFVCDIDPRTGEIEQYSATDSTGKLYFIDLDRRKTINFVNDAGTLQSYYTGNKIETIDVNGDGKTDFLHFVTGRVYVYSLNSSNQMEVLWTTVDNDINPINSSILPGDYNGDGKMDFLISKGTGLQTTQWVKFLSNGNAFEKFPQTYFFNNYGTLETATTVNSKINVPVDINGDGKTDIVNITSYYEKNSSSGNIAIAIYNNVDSTFSAGQPSLATGMSSAIKSYAVPIFLTPNKNNKNLALGIISDNLLYHFASLADFSKQALLKEVKDGNLVSKKITYSGLEHDQYESIYTPSVFTETFPNIDVNAAPNFKVVRMLEEQSSGQYKKQVFSYAGGVSNAEGLGFLGFRATMKTNWYSDGLPIISTVSKNSIGLRGANIENFDVLGLSSPEAPAPSSFISRSVLDYNTAADALQTNKVFKLKNTGITKFNGLDDTSSITTNTLDQFNNLTSVLVQLKEGSNIIHTSTTDISYKTENLSPFYRGVPDVKTITSVVNGSTMSSEERYDYTSGNFGLLEQIRKKGDASTNYVTEKNDYDSFGNVVKKTISASGLVPRITSYEYDQSGRFLIKSTDIDLLFKTFDYNLNSGVLNSETNQNGLTTTYLYDSWFKKIKTTDYLGKSNAYTYSKSSEKSIITNTGDDESVVEETYDDLGRKVKVKVKDIAGNFSAIDYFYDIYNRNYKTSEPYFGSNSSQFNETQYDEYGRFKKSISFTGNTVQCNYFPLTTRSEITENSKTKTIIKNVTGNTASITDSPGGTITYTYYANGSLKESDFAGSKTTITLDGWGRKTKLVDSSAGTYTYEYNDLGEITKETTPNGTTTYIFDDYGKVKEKTIVGGITTNSKTSYTYDTSSKLLVKIEFEDFINGGSIINDYTYDPFKRVSTAAESTQYAVFAKEFTYDAFGRVDTNTLTAQAGGKSSSRVLRNTYKNGAHWQILDDATSAVLWATQTVDARGKLLTAVCGPVALANSYDNYGYVSEFNYNYAASPSINILKLTTSFDAQKANLDSRTNSLFNRSETFKYDALDRLTEFTNVSGNQENQTYDDRGRILQNSVGLYNYTNNNKLYQNTSVDLTADALTYYTGRQALDVTYNTFKSPFEIHEAGIDRISFIYNDNNSRSAMFYGGLQADKLQRSFGKYYSSDGLMEIKHNLSNGGVDIVTYIGGDAYSAPLILKSDGTSQNYFYLLRDHQSSIIAVADQSGTIIEKRLFDAWGNIASVQDNAGNILAGLTVLDRGYTGHEHLQSIGIIHMNGRLYDPKLHRFMQPDNFVQDPYNTQNYNRYGYCWNNPLKYTDASGEWIHIVAGAVIGGLVNWGVHGFRLDMDGLKAFGIGAGAGALGAMTGGAAFVGMGGAAGGLGGFAAGAVGGGVGAFYSVGLTNAANNAVLGDPLMSGEDLGFAVMQGALTGGMINGVGALLNGNSFWTGTPPRVSAQPITLPKPAGLEKIDGNKTIKTGDYKISNSTKSTTAPTSSNNASGNIDIDNGYVDLSNRPEFNKISSQADDIMDSMVQVRHHTDIKGLNGIKNSGFIRPARYEPFGVDVEVAPFLKPSQVNLGQWGGGIKGGGGYIEFSVPRSQLTTPPTYMGGTGNVGRVLTGGDASTPFSLSGTNPIFVKNWWPF
ncbi:RHS repeat-associated core domain-containing protein [Flavobacterium sp. SORGH_AS_0622]|uniref:RHS repeat-associated core domain-containing protein n=1 Tax=Flavobacterium sp. SORGH_AS_0622 TaxID=3041772 RepID=UPI00277EFFE0|nr:RHS repeat-associated core domain-containing protein [Flavobacterium sp. SORGH_AS_0622]MDQ1165676.1 RHS repeat-associated protein [Flavobacterium sp. SORGH_AS_0622]